MSGEPAGPRSELVDLESSVAAIATAPSASEVFRLLIDGSGVASPRSAVFLLREGAFKGWGARGHDAEASRRLRALRIPATGGFLARVVAPSVPAEPVRLEPGLDVPDFGQPVSADAVGVAIRVGGRTVAALVAERGPEETPWSPAALAILRTVVELRLELDLAARRLRTVAPSAPPESGTDRPAETPEVVPATGASWSATPPPSGEASLAPWLETAPAGPESPRLEEARRFARLVATDIRLYNEEAILVGRRNRDLVRRLAEAMERGRETFAGRFADLGDEGRVILREAYVQILAGGDPTLLAPA
jgi:hypothetical protein